MSQSTHLAAVLEVFNTPYALKQVPTPDEAALQGHDVLIKVLAASYCHTDSVFASGKLSQALPRVGCHEFAGEIIALGPEAASYSRQDIAVGVRVGVPGRAFRPCGTCWECQHTGKDPLGYSTYCPRAGNLGLTIDGGFQEYAVADGRQVAPLPDGLPFTQAAPLMCAGVTIWSALQHERVKSAKRIAILGAGGGLGHLGVQFAAHLGMEVLAIDASDKGVELMENIKAGMGEAGNRVFVGDGRTHSVDQLKTLIGETGDARPPTEVGVEAVIMLPESQHAFDLGLQLLRNHGTMVVVSFPTNKLQVSAHDLVFRDIQVVGTLVGRNHQARDMLKFVVKHDIQAQISTCPLKHLNEGIQKQHSDRAGPGKLVVDFSLD